MRSALTGLGQAFRRPHFVAGAVTLAVAVAGLQAAVRHFEVVFRKLPVELRVPLDALKPDLFAPEYKLVHVGVLSPEVLQELGTDQYVYWVLQNTGRSSNDPLSVANVFVTYYTGDPDQVPHVPDVCYLGGGFQSSSASTLLLDMPQLSDSPIPVRSVTFTKNTFGRHEAATVLYLFSVNGRYKATRTDVRTTLSNPLERHAYFSKVEVSFRAAGDSVESVEAGEQLLRRLLPELAGTHWPDWEAVKSGSDGQNSSSSVRQ